MDTRDQTLTKLTRLHDKSHPTHHRPAILRWNYSRTAVSIMKLVMEDGWWWRWRRIPLSGAPNGLQISPPERVQGLAVALYRKTRWILLFDFFLSESEYMELELRSVERQGAHVAGARPPPSWTGCGPPGMDLSSSIFIYSKIIPRWFSGHSENFYFCTKITPWQFC